MTTKQHRSNGARWRTVTMECVLVAAGFASLSCDQRIQEPMEALGENPPAPATAAAAPIEAETTASALTSIDDLGREVAVPQHLRDGDEFRISLGRLLRHGKLLFEAVWTPQEGNGRPLTKGNGNPLSDPASPLVFPRNFNRLSAMDANSCTSCHNTPILGGGGHFTANAFIPGQRFDFMTFDHSDGITTRGARDERGQFPTLQGITNSRASLGMFGSGFIEMLARQITSDLRAIRDAIPPGGSAALTSKGISYGVLKRAADGSWITADVQGLPAQALLTTGAANPPSLVVRPFHQAGTVVSIREFTNNAFNHHHGIQSTERFGLGADPDGDGFANELSRADVTAASIFQATLAVPGRVIPRDPVVEAAVAKGERKFVDIGCASCHRTSLPLVSNGWVFSEPNPFNPPTNLRPGDAPPVAVDLTSSRLPAPRLRVRHGVVHVPAFTDLKIHDITSGPSDPNADPIDMNEPVGSDGFFAGTRKFLTKKLWGAASEPPFFHHGKFVTLREAILAHAGEAQSSSTAFRALSKYEQNAIIEFLKTLKTLPAGATSLVVDENGQARTWTPAYAAADAVADQ
jgi:hypothetical protein